MNNQELIRHKFPGQLYHAHSAFVRWHRRRIVSVTREIFQNYCDFQAPITVLDSGCGDGEMTQEFLSYPNVTAYGVDLGFGSLQEGVQRAEAINAGDRALFIRASIEDMSFLPDQYFDVIYDYGLISLVPNPDKAYAEYMRLAKPNAILMLEIPPKWSTAHLSYLLKPPDEEWYEHPTRWNNLKFWKRLERMRFYSKAEIKTFLDNTGGHYHIMEHINLWYYYFEQKSLQHLLDKLSQIFGEGVFDRIDKVFQYLYRIPSGYFLVIRKLDDQPQEMVKNV